MEEKLTTVPTKEKIKRIIGLIFIIVGVTIILVIGYQKYETSKKQKELKNILEEIITEPISSDGQTIGKKLTKSEIEFLEGFTPIALMEIPSIKLEQGIVSGISDNVLEFYLGHFEDSAMPGEKGNFSVAGHRVSSYSEAFVNLYKAEVGEEIIVKSNGKKYIYKITEMIVVDPSDISVLEDTEEATITLVTCTVGAEERLIVKGILDRTEDL